MQTSLCVQYCVFYTQLCYWMLHALPSHRQKLTEAAQLQWPCILMNVCLQAELVLNNWMPCGLNSIHLGLLVL